MNLNYDDYEDLEFEIIRQRVRPGTPLRRLRDAESWREHTRDLRKQPHRAVGNLGQVRKYEAGQAQQ